MKSYDMLLEEAMEDGLVYHTCPECGGETAATEPDGETTWCGGCNKEVSVERVI